MSSRFLVVYELMGTKPVERLLCLASKLLGMRTLIMLGNTVSPLSVSRLVRDCKLSIAGILGDLDNPAVARAFQSEGLLLECRVAQLEGLRILGHGVSCSLQSLPAAEVDLVVTAKPGIQWGCCKPGSDIVDYICNTYKPLLAITGGCNTPCQGSKVFSPGSLRLNYVGLIELDLRNRTWRVTAKRLDEILNNY